MNYENFSVEREEQNEWVEKAFSTIVRPSIIFDKSLPYIPKGKCIEDYITSSISLDDFFHEHYPSIQMTDVHSISFCFKIEIVHPTFLNVSSDYSKDDWFEFKDFINPINNRLERFE